jgi:hypothetical protein
LLCHKEEREGSVFVFFRAITGADPVVMDPVPQSMNWMRLVRRMIFVIKGVELRVNATRNSSGV